MRSGIVAASAVFLTVILGAAASQSSGEVGQSCSLIEASSSACHVPLAFVSISPLALPRTKFAPVTILIGVRSRRAGVLSSVSVSWSSRGRLDLRGLPSCRRSQLETTSPGAALRVCRDAIVGSGSASLDLGLVGNSTPLYLFNGGQREGKATLFVYGVNPYPNPTPMVVPVTIERLAENGYGLLASADIPAMPGGFPLASFELKIGRLFKRDGRIHGYVSARCPAPLGFRQAELRVAKVAYAWDGDGEEPSVSTTSIVRSCKARPPAGGSAPRG